jgi:YHS domain-containing protein
MMFYKSMVAMTISVVFAVAASAQHDPSTHKHDAPEHGKQTSAGEMQHSAELPAGPHGGQLQTAGAVQVETLVEAGGLKVFAYDGQGQALDVRGARGVATLKAAGDSKRYRYDLFPEVRQDQSAESLGVSVDLSRTAGQNVDINFELVGLVPGQRQPTQFAASLTVPMTEPQQVAAAIAEQKICPVSGQPLGAMGKPIPVTFDGQTVYVCCAACVDKVKATPENYFSAKPTVELAAVTKEDAPLIAQQAKCPVMDEPLGSMGQPVKLLVNGKPIFLCCKGCVKKVEADPQKYLTQVYGDAVLPTVASGGEEVRPGVFKVTAADQPFIAAQKLCPVMDEPLDGMGGPYRVTAEGRAIYICCPGCAKKIAASPQKYFAILQAKGVEPPLVK